MITRELGSGFSLSRYRRYPFSELLLSPTSLLRRRRYPHGFHRSEDHPRPFRRQILQHAKLEAGHVTPTSMRDSASHGADVDLIPLA